MNPKKIPSIFMNHDWLVIDKPTGISTHAANEGDLGISEWLELHHAIKVHVCSRLDKGTSGLLVIALNAEASHRAQEIHENNSSKKTYYFLSDKKYEKSSQWICQQKLDGASCETHFKLEQSGEGYYLYSAQITRGKKHQIRRHASLCGVPILGDDEYNGSPFSRLCLHCTEVHWPEINETLQTELPKSFQFLLTAQEHMLTHAQVTIEKRLLWLSSITNAFRIVHREEILGLPFTIDVFDKWMCVNYFDEEMNVQDYQRKIEPIISHLSQYYQTEGGIIKTNKKDPHHRKLFGDFASWGKSIPKSFSVNEHHLKYEISLNADQHPGLFLDQRDTRQKLKSIAYQKRVANLFAFTCSFSLVAIAAEAEVVFSVDLADSALARGKTNFEINQLNQTNRAKFVQKDVRSWLEKEIKKQKDNPNNYSSWDIVICDPPVFAATDRGSSFSVSKAWPELAENIKKILSPNGIALFANNHRKGNDHFYQKILQQHFTTVIQMRPPFDFPLSQTSPPDVRIFWCYS